MFATVHDVTGLPGPLEDPAPAVQDAVRSAGSPAGLVIARAFNVGEGILLALWTTAEEAQRAGQLGGGLAGARIGTASIGPSQVFRITHQNVGARAVEPHYVQLVSFSGPRTAEWVRAIDRADQDRIWPAVRDLPGVARTLTLQAADGERVVLVLVEGVETFEEGTRRLLSTELLPDEDPDFLTGPDRIVVARLLITDLPVEVAR